MIWKLSRQLLAQADPLLGFDSGTLTVDEMVDQFRELTK